MTYRQWEAIPEEDKHALLDELVENNGLLAHNDDGTFYVTELGEQYINARLAFAGGELPPNRWLTINFERTVETGSREQLEQKMQAINDELAPLGIRLVYSIEEVQS